MRRQKEVADLRGDLHKGLVAVEAQDVTPLPPQREQRLKSGRFSMVPDELERACTDERLGERSVRHTMQTRCVRLHLIPDVPQQQPLIARADPVLQHGVVPDAQALIELFHPNLMTGLLNGERGQDWPPENGALYPLIQIGRRRQGEHHLTQEWRKPALQKRMPAHHHAFEIDVLRLTKGTGHENLRLKRSGGLEKNQSPRVRGDS